VKTASSMDEQYERLKGICERAGIKLTHQRFEIFREVASATDHPTPEAIYSRLKPRLPSLALDTVYRALATFSELGIIKKVFFSDSHSRFDPNIAPHQHFICTRCNKVIDFEWEEFENISVPEEAKKMGKVTERHAELRGICKACLDAPKS